MVLKMQKRGENSLTLSIENIRSRIYTIRDRQVMLDSDLAELYSVETKRLNEQVRRNISRFPKEFMFQLTNEEFYTLRPQFVTSKNSKETDGKPDYLKPQIVTSNEEKALR